MTKHGWVWPRLRGISLRSSSSDTYSLIAPQSQSKRHGPNSYLGMHVLHTSGKLNMLKFPSIRSRHCPWQNKYMVLCLFAVSPSRLAQRVSPHPDHRLEPRKYARRLPGEKAADLSSCSHVNLATRSHLNNISLSLLAIMVSSFHEWYDSKVVTWEIRKS